MQSCTSCLASFPVTRALFHPDDDALLHYLNDDGLSIEPEFYVPVIPLVLVNGADGIGTGYSTSIPCYNPRDVCAAVRARITGAECPPLKPWYRGFTGTIEAKDATRFLVSGTASVDDDGATLTISELPIRRWTQDCKALLVSFVTGETAAAKGDDSKATGGSKGAAKGAAAAAAKKKATAAAGKPAKPPKAAKAPAAAAASAAEPAAPAKRPAKAVRKVMADEDSEDDGGDDDDDEEFDVGAAVESASDDEEEAEAKPKKARAAAADVFIAPPGEPLLLGFNENHTDTTVSFTVTPTPLLAPLFEKNAGKRGADLSPALRKLFKLETTISTSNMVLFDAEGHSESTWIAFLLNEPCTLPPLARSSIVRYS